MADDAERGLQDLLLERLASDAAPSNAVSDLVLAAWEGQEALASALAGEHRPSIEAADTSPTAEHGQVFLAAIHVEGFRGIGKEATLPLRPGPGLTLVTGRNGSGKSSFAEGAEVALTGTSARWSGRSAVWKTGWRNLHSEADPKVSVDLIVSGEPKTTRIARAWAAGDEVGEGRWTRQLQGQKVEPFDGASWREPMQTYRPFLSYGELGAVIDGKPTELHDALHSLLGLGALTAALDRLSALRKAFDKDAKAANAARRELQADLAAVEGDDRAARAAALLKSTKVDLEAATALALGTDDDAAEIAQLRRLLELRVPDRAEVEATVARLRAAADTVAGLADDQSEAADRVAALLRSAVAHHHVSGDGSCPVCGKGRLTAAWSTRAEKQAADLEQSSGLLRVANADLRSAVAQARSLTSPVPRVLEKPSPVDTAPARAAWQAWSDAGALQGPVELAHAIEAALPPLVDAINTAQTYAADELTKRDEEWQPYALRLSTWIGQAEQVRKVAEAFKTIADAENWLKSAAADLRTQRMAPFADGSQKVWQQLRQQSNVELGPVRLEGSANRRQVAMNVSIDGASGGTALGVMSQGELHALGLSLFLPRATVDDSPFRFVMIDDPVQAMDPAKVDGLARVLAEVALTRQVIVFSHDDRLAEAVRRLETPATVWEVHRREHSVIEVVPGTDAVSRYLEDARALAKSAGIPADLRTELVASCCRSAIEAACQMKVRAVRLSRGESLGEVEAVLAEAPKTTQKMSLAVFDDAHREGDLYVRLNRSAGLWAVDALKACNKGAHFGVHPGELKDLVRDCMKLAQWVQK